MADITMDTDWGAKGAQLTGAQVQTFIKDHLKALQATDKTLQSKLTNATNSANQASELGYNACSACKVAVATNNGLELYDWDNLAIITNDPTGHYVMGICLIPDGGVPFVVGLERPDSGLEWSKMPYASPNTMHYASDACKDMEGKAKCKAITDNGASAFGSAAEGSWVTYALGWCYNYSRTVTMNGAPRGIGAGSWYMPTVAQLLMIYKYRKIINAYIQELGVSAAPIDGGSFWSCNDYNAISAFGLDMDSGKVLTEIIKAATNIDTIPVADWCE